MAYHFFLITVVSLLAWVGNYRRYRGVADTPTARVASAAQGYTELFGMATHLPNTEPLVSKLKGLPCVWYRYLVERRSSNNKDWSTVEQGESSAPFLLVDETGSA
jgi:hypothetical protein